MLDNPVPFSEVFAGENIPYIQVHLAQTVVIDGKDALVGFCGIFSYDGQTITPLDGDSYSGKMSVIGYKWFTTKDGERALDILVTDW